MLVRQVLRWNRWGYSQVLYEYKCDNCEEIFSIVSSVAKMKSVENCVCGAEAHRYYGNQRVNVDYNIGAYDKGLGCYVESSSHRRNIMKSRGLEAIDSDDRMFKHVESKREEVKKNRDIAFKRNIREKIRESRTITV